MRAKLNDHAHGTPFAAVGSVRNRFDQLGKELGVKTLGEVHSGPPTSSNVVGERRRVTSTSRWPSDWPASTATGAPADLAIGSSTGVG